MVRAGIEPRRRRQRPVVQEPRRAVVASRLPNQASTCLLRRTTTPRDVGPSPDVPGRSRELRWLAASTCAGPIGPARRTFGAPVPGRLPRPPVLTPAFQIFVN